MNPNTPTARINRLPNVNHSPLSNVRRVRDAPDSQLDRVKRALLIDLTAAERAVADLLVALGEDLDDHHIRDTPRRVASAFAEMLTPRSFNLTTFPNDEDYNELVLARNIPFHSLCQHHMLPFKGVAHVGYLPG